MHENPDYLRCERLMQCGRCHALLVHRITPISENDLKTKLKNIVIRQNQIVHKGDCLSTQPPLQQQIISKSDTEDVINFIKELVNAIKSCI